MTDNDQHFMSRALELAKQGRCSVSPNPMVGCVIVQNGRTVGEGWHRQAGGPHAETYALEEAGIDAKGATLYVTLEPCSHQGRTGPCVDKIIAAGVSRVVMAVKDPNPIIDGVTRLQAAGISVDIGCCAKEATELNKIFFHYQKTRRPFVIAKWAMSLDGRTITHPEDTRFITDEKTKPHAHAIRQQVDAILIGSGTALADDPLLTVRSFEGQVRRIPKRIVITTSGQLPVSLKLFNLDATTIVATTKEASADFIEKVERLGHKVWLLPTTDLGNIDLSQLLTRLGQAGVTSLLVEGGEVTRNHFLSENLVNEVQAYVAPVIIGELTKKKQIAGFCCKTLEKDVFFRGALDV